MQPISAARLARHLLPVLLPAFLAASACGGEEAPDADPDGGPDPEVTWHGEIAPLVARHCTGCHSEGGIAPFSLEEYDSARLLAPLMVQKVRAGEMPPWDAVATADCEPRLGWRDDPRPSAEDIELLARWDELGAPEGDPASAAPLPEPPDLELADATHRVTPEVGYATSGDTDEFICFVLDPGIDRASWVTGVHFVPSDLAVAHHAVVNVVPPEGRDALLAQAGEDGVFDCFGGVNAPGSYFLGVWVPGALPFEAPEGVGVPVAADSLLVMQMHYHPGGESHPPERTEVQLRVTDRRPPRQLLFTAIGNAPAAPILQPGPGDDGQVQFRVPAGSADHTEEMVFPIALDTDQRFPLLSVFPHMHYVGVDLEVNIERATPLAGEPSEECLVKIPTWDFEWQRTYLYDAAIDELPTVGDGDTLTIRCRYDNTLANPYVERALAEQGLPAPIDVFLGEQTLDEMCLAAFGIIVD